MSYASVMSRISDLESRLGVNSAPVNVAAGFDKALATAKSGFVDVPGPKAGPADDALKAQGARASRLLSSGHNRFGQAPHAPHGAVPAAHAPASAPVAGGGGGTKVTPKLNGLFHAASARHGVPVALIKAVARAESGFRADAVSPAGAQGMMQLMPATGRGLGVTDPFDPAQSIEGGTRYLKNALKMFDGDTKLALAAYNAGPGAVKKYGGIPPYRETQNYVTKVLGFAREFGLPA